MTASGKRYARYGMMTEKELGNALRQALMVFDGAMGTEIYLRHVFTNRCYDEFSFS